jgi:membrane fusion protein (multidrug efflux system)
MRPTTLRLLGGTACAALLSLTLAACSDSPATPRAEKQPAPQPVSFISVHAAPLPLIHELPGRVAPTRIAEVRARVSGIVISRNFEQGADVKAGDVLYRLDAAPFEIELRAAEAAVAKAKAVLEQEKQNARRMEALAPTKAVSQSQVDTAVASLRQAEADVAARDADVARAKLNLEYTRIRAPISGRIGRALVTEGALVGQSTLTHVATIQQLDPIYADFTQSVAELNQLRREFANGDLERVAPDSAKVRLILDNGEVYPLRGKLLFSDTTVDPGTGQVTLRGEFANPKMELLPGMYVRVQIEQGIDPDALAVPQQAVRRNDSGTSEVYVVRDDNRASLVPVKLGRAVDDRWMILDGVKPGDRVIVDGFQKFVPGDVVSPKLWRNRGVEQRPQRSADADDGHVKAR